jgi:hypothetical protein
MGAAVHRSSAGAALMACLPRVPEYSWSRCPRRQVGTRGALRPGSVRADQLPGLLHARLRRCQFARVKPPGEPLAYIHSLFLPVAAGTQLVRNVPEDHVRPLPGCRVYPWPRIHEPAQPLAQSGRSVILHGADGAMALLPPDGTPAAGPGRQTIARRTPHARTSAKLSVRYWRHDHAPAPISRL